MKKKYKVLAVVAARGGSKGIKNKNLKKIGNQPLVLHVIKTLSLIKNIDTICLSSDSLKITNVVQKKFPNIQIDLREKKLSGDKVPLTSVAKSVCEKYNKNGKYHDIILQVAPTCPFIKKKTVELIIQKLINKESNCAVTLKRIEHEHPYRAKEIYKKNYFRSLIKNINVEKFISRQDLPEFYCTSGSIYARTNKLLSTFDEKDFCLGKYPIGIIVDDYEAINIDRPIDLEFANFIAKKYKINF
tara:strand:- start:855 stop:1586 length:732 start_codon:yes stop_codon:yes gene_type:complete